MPAGVEMPGTTEDDVTSGRETMTGTSSRDTVIAVSASGTTPCTAAAAGIAQSRGATLIAIASNPGAERFDGDPARACPCVIFSRQLIRGIASGAVI